MEHHERELLIARISSGVIRCTATNPSLLIRKPTREQLYIAQEIYSESYKDASLQELMTDEELYDFLMENELWDEERESFLNKLPTEIEDFKVALYKARFKSNERKTIRNCLDIARAKLSEVTEQRHAYDYLTCAGVAAVARSRYLLGCSIGGNAPFEGESTRLLDEVMQFYFASRIEETHFRELARTDPWRSIWSGRSCENGLFGIPAVDYTEEQRSLVCWSMLYDSVYQHPECPSDESIKDDDLFDGWLIDQRRQRDQRSNQASGDSLIENEKIRNSQEQYLVADTVEDARRIMDLNDEHGKHIQRKRFALIDKKGQVNELDMPDTKQRLRTAITNKLAQQARQT